MGCVAADVSRLLAGAKLRVGPQQVTARWELFPEPVQRYLRVAIPDGAPAIGTARLRHDGEFRTKPGARWFPIQGEEYFTIASPGFLWQARMRVAPLLWVDACDRLIAGRGHMLVRFNSLITLADVSGPQIDQGAHARWLAEAVWFPPAFAGPLFEWKHIDRRSARVTLECPRAPVSAVVEFDGEGQALRISGERYRSTGRGQAVLTPWLGKCSDYREFGGLRVPSSVEALWGLPEGEFSYARFRVTGLEYDVAAPASELLHR
jgi:hypothetical protein